MTKKVVDVHLTAVPRLASRDKAAAPPINTDFCGRVLNVGTSSSGCAQCPRGIPEVDRKRSQVAYSRDKNGHRKRHAKVSYVISEHVDASNRMKD